MEWRPKAGSGENLRHSQRQVCDSVVQHEFLLPYFEDLLRRRHVAYLLGLSYYSLLNIYLCRFDDKPKTDVFHQFLRVGNPAVAKPPSSSVHFLGERPQYRGLASERPQRWENWYSTNQYNVPGLWNGFVNLASHLRPIWGARHSLRVILGQGPPEPFWISVVPSPYILLCVRWYCYAEVGKVVLKSNSNEALSAEC